MADQVYTIQLNVKVNDSEVSNLEKRIGHLDGRRIGRGGGRPAGGGAGTYGNIPPSQQAYFRALNSRFGRTPGFSNEGFLSNVNRLYHRTGVFQRSFLGNMTSFSGWLRNLSNFGTVLGSIGRIAGGVVPVVGKLGGALLTLGKAYIAYKGASMAIRGGAIMLGNRLINSQGLGEAGSNLMQFSMARKGLGGYYQSSFNEATRLAAEYGFSRTGILNSINMLSGLDIGGRRLSRQEATRIATQAGKIAHVGGVPFERVNINLQQLLGQPTPSARDLRELIQAAPIIGKLAQQAMSNKNISGDVFSYLKDKSALLAVLNDFDKMIESNPFMRARGMTQLHKENALIRIVNENANVWPKIAESMGVFYDSLANVTNKYLPKIATLITPEKISQLFSDVENAITGLYNILSGIIDLVKLVPRIIPLGHSDQTKGSAGWIPGPGGTIRPVTNLGNRFSYDAAGNKYPVYNTDSLYNSRQRAALKDIINRDSSYLINTLAAYQSGSSQLVGGIPVPSPGFTPTAKQRAEAVRAFRARSGEFVKNPSSVLRETKTVDNGVYWDLDYRKLFENFTPTDLNGSAANAATSDGLSDITKGSRALIINFNREIVNMPITIDKVNDGADLGSQLMGALNDNIVRGLQIALNNATGVM